MRDKKSSLIIIIMLVIIIALICILYASYMHIKSIFQAFLNAYYMLIKRLLYSTYLLTLHRIVPMQSLV